MIGYPHDESCAGIFSQSKAIFKNKNMTEGEFLEKYGSEIVYFESLYKFIANYSNEELGIYCFGNFDYHTELSKEETVAFLFGQFETFSFGFINKKD